MKSKDRIVIDEKVLSLLNKLFSEIVFVGEAVEKSGLFRS